MEHLLLITAGVARLYWRNPFSERWPVRDIISCSSIPASNNIVAQVLFPEWFVKLPSIPALLNIVETKVLSLFIPTTASLYLRPSFNGLLKKNPRLLKAFRYFSKRSSRHLGPEINKEINKYIFFFKIKFTARMTNSLDPDQTACCLLTHWYPKFNSQTNLCILISFIYLFIISNK